MTDLSFRILSNPKNINIGYYLHVPCDGAVYKITFIDNNGIPDNEKVYIGSAFNLRSRCSTHKSNLTSESSSVPLYQYMKSKDYNFIDNTVFHVMEYLQGDAMKIDRERKLRERHYVIEHEKEHGWSSLLNHTRPLEHVLECPHGKKNRSSCKDCHGTRICKHGRIGYICKDCRGLGICSHGCIKYHCKDCEDSKGRCEHGRIRYYCKDCLGSGVCTHGRIRYYCTDCEGCPHGRIRHYCKDCGGLGICPHSIKKNNCKICSSEKLMCHHGIKKYNCKDCVGSGICTHGVRKYYCKDCGGLGICPHGARKNRCAECGTGSEICSHGNVKYTCKDCVDSKGRCEHGRLKHICKDCGGSAVCPHGRRKYICRDCSPWNFCIEHKGNKNSKNHKNCTFEKKP